MYTISRFIDDIEKALYPYHLGEFKVHEEKNSCGYLEGSTDLKKVSYIWYGKEIANIILDTDLGTTIVHARKSLVKDDLHIIHPFFLKRYVRKCMKYELKWIKGRNKIWDIFDDIHRPRLDMNIPYKENKEIVLSRIAEKCFEEYAQNGEQLGIFLKKIAKYVAPNWTVDINVTTNPKEDQ